MSGKFTEQALLLGSRQSLVGILTRPTPAQTAKPAIVILNTGIVHRVGHHRMYVTMARACASAGHTVLRFDFSGIGDSERRADRLSPVNACLADIKEALDSLEGRHRISQFVLIGLCSGADYAVLYGHTDPRVVGLVLMDPSIPPTARYYFHYVAQRLRSLRNWLSVATGRSGLLRLLMAQFGSPGSEFSATGGRHDRVARTAFGCGCEAVTPVHPAATLATPAAAKPMKALRLVWPFLASSPSLPATSVSMPRARVLMRRRHSIR